MLPKKPRGLQVFIPKPNVLIILLRSGVEPKKIGFEPVIFEMLGGLEAEAVRLCESLYQAVDRKIQ